MQKDNLAIKLKILVSKLKITIDLIPNKEGKINKERPMIKAILLHERYKA